MVGNVPVVAYRQAPEEGGPKTKPGVIVIIPCYNEEVAIGSIILRSKVYADEVVAIDDGSTDRTALVAKLAGATVISHASNMGKGAVIKDAFHYARKVGADIMVLIDGDGQHDPDEIPVLLHPITDGVADMVNGSRFLDRTGNMVPRYRRLGQKILNIATNMGTSKKLTDTQNGFRAFSSRTFKCFTFNERGMAIESEMLMEASRAGIRIVEVPINVRYDVDGSTYNPISHGFAILNKVLMLISLRRPLMFFSLPGVLLITLGIGIFAMVISIFNETQVVAMGYTMLGILCNVIGTLSVFTGLMLWSIQSISMGANKSGDNV